MMKSAKEQLKVLGFTLQVVFIDQKDSLLAYYIIKYKNIEVYNTKDKRDLWTDKVTPDELSMSFISDPHLFTLLDNALPNTFPSRDSTLMYLTMYIRKYLYYRKNTSSSLENVLYGFIKAKDILKHSTAELYQEIKGSSDPYIEKNREDILNSPVFKMTIDADL